MADILDDDFWIARAVIVKALIVAYDAAILALSAGAQTYTIDTGQTRQVVQRSSLGELRNARQSLLNELVTIDALVNGGGRYVAPVV